MEAPMSPVPMTTATSGSPAMLLAVSSSAADAVMVTAQDSVALAVDRQPDSDRYRRSAAVALPSQSVLVAAWAAARDPDLRARCPRSAGPLAGHPRCGETFGATPWSGRGSPLPARQLQAFSTGHCRRRRSQAP